MRDAFLSIYLGAPFSSMGSPIVLISSGGVSAKVILSCESGAVLGIDILSNFRSSSGSRSISSAIGALSVSSVNSTLDRFLLLGIYISPSIGLIFRDSFLVFVKENPNSGSENTSNTRAIMSNKAKTLTYGTDANMNHFLPFTQLRFRGGILSGALRHTSANVATLFIPITYTQIAATALIAVIVIIGGRMWKRMPPDSEDLSRTDLQPTSSEVV